jgi:hypothetical protein
MSMGSGDAPAPPRASEATGRQAIRIATLTMRSLWLREKRMSAFRVELLGAEPDPGGGGAERPSGTFEVEGHLRAVAYARGTDILEHSTERSFGGSSNDSSRKPAKRLR